MRILATLVLTFFLSGIISVAAPPAPATAAPAAATDAFAQKMEEVAALERAGDFRKAMLLLRRLRQEFRDPKQVLAIDGAIEHVRSLSEAGVGAGDAITQLGSSDRRTAEVARRQLLASGPAGLIMLRKALQTGTQIAAANAADALGEAKDKDAAPLLLERLAQEKGRTPPALAIMRALARMEKELTPEQLAQCDGAMAAGSDTSRCELADVLMAALGRRAGGKAEDYDKLIGRQGAYESLRDAFSRAVISGDPGLVAWACREGELFLPSVRGFRATYYSDPGFVNPVLERFEPTIEKKPEDPFPFPNGQKTTLSVRWEADLTIGSAGAYAFAMSADDAGTIYLDGSNIVSTGGGQARGCPPISLTAGVYRIRADYVQEQDAAHYKVWWGGPGLQDSVNLPVSTRPMPEQMIQLVRTLDQLTSTNWAASRAVKDRVISGGEAGMMALRDAVVKREEPVAIAAMEYLSLENDARLFPALVRRSADPNISPLLKQKIAEAMRLVALSATSADCTALLSGITEGGCADRMVSIAGLCAVLDRKCAGSEEKFNALCGKADARSTLKAAVDATYDSKLAEDAVWLAAFGQPFVMKANGLSGRYWRGSRRDQFVLQRTDRQIELWERVPPLTDAGIVELSAVWDGALQVPADGEYKFFMRGQNDARLWIDDELVMVNGNRHQEPVVARKLSKGMHRIKASLGFWWDAPAMTLAWEGPGIPKQIIPLSHLSSAPSMEAATNAVAALAILPGLSNPALGIPAQRAVRGLDGAAAPVLLQAIREASDAVAVEALLILTDMPPEARDAHAASSVIARAGRAAAPALRDALAFAMRDVAASISDAQCKAMLDAIRTGAGMDKGMAMAGLCAVLDRACGGKAGDFNKRCGAPGAYDAVKAAADAAVMSTNAAESAFAVSFGRPFSPLAPGLRARYWRGYNFELPGLARREDHIEVYDKVAGFSDAGNFEMSGRWEGILNVPADADYKFILSAQNDGRVWIDGTQVVTHIGGHRTQEAAATAKLSAGPHRIKAEMRFGNEAPGMRLFWEGPGIPRQFIAGDSFAVEPWPSILAEGEAALLRLTNRADQQSYFGARRTVMSLGPAGSVMLRRAFRDGPEPLAAEALGMLMEKPRGEMDAGLVAILLDRAGKGGSPALRIEIARALRGAAAGITEQDLKRMVAALRTGAGMDKGLALAGLCGLLDGVCGGKAEDFNKRCGEADAHEVLKAAVSQSVSSGSLDEIAWMTAFGQPFVPSPNGMRARYWRGSQFDLLAIDRREDRIEQYERIPGITEKEPVELSARWEGVLNVPAGGDYAFIIASQNEGKLWIDGKLVVASGGQRNQEVGGNATLTAGPHRLRADLRFWNDWPGMRVWWAGPNLPRQIVGGAYMSCEADPQAVLAAAKALGRMRGLDNEGEYLACRRSVQSLGAAAGPMLRAALRQGPDALAAPEAMRFLVEAQDPEAVKVLAELMGTNKTLRVDPLLLDGFVQLAPVADSNTLAWCLSEVRQAASPDVDACLAMLCRVYLNSGGGDPGPLNRLTRDPKTLETIKAAAEAALKSPDMKVLARALRYGQPFAPFVEGATTRYYFGDMFDKLFKEQIEWSFGFTEYRGPQGWRGNNVSAVFDGFIRAPQAGDYVFRISARGEGTLWLDNKPFFALAGAENVKGTNMSAGFHPIRFALRQPGQDNNFFLHTDRTPMNGNRAGVDGSLVVSPPPAAMVASLEQAARDLENKDPARVSAVRTLLNVSGEPGLAFIRNLMFNAPEKTGVSLAGLMVSQRPADTAGVLMGMLRKKPKPESVPTLVSALAAVAEQIQPDDALWIHDGTFETTGLNERQQLRLLAAIADRACNGDKAAFGALMKGKSQAWDALSQRFTVMTETPNTNEVFWALENGGPFVPKVGGVRGRFYDGQAFDRLYADVREECVDRRGEPFHGHGNPLSAWWTGSFEAKQAGRYRVRLVADDFGRIWIDGRLVVDGWTTGTGKELWGEADLAAGWHTFDARYRQSEGDRSVQASIQGPGLNGRFDQAFVRCNPPAGFADWLHKELDKLGNDQTAGQAGQVAGQWRPMSDLFLRNMVRFASPVHARRSADILAGWRDAGAKAIILNRAASTPDENLKKALEEAAKKIQ